MKNPGAGRYVVGAVAVLGVAGVVGWGTLQSKDRANTTAAADDAPSGQRPVLEVVELTKRSQRARAAADISELLRLEPKLAEAVAQASLQPKRLLAQLELADVLATRALEATLRGTLVAELRPAAIAQAQDAIAQYESLKLDASQPNTRTRAASGRIALAKGDAIEDHYAVVLLPTHRDTELRLLAIAQPLWRAQEGESMAAGELAELVLTLREEPRRTGLLNLLLAIALRQQGNADDALVVIDELLAEVPTQPTAKALRARWTGQLVAVAGGRTPDIRGDGLDVGAHADAGDLIIDDDGGDDIADAARKNQRPSVGPKRKPEPDADPAPEADPAAPEADPVAPEADPLAPEADPVAPEADPVPEANPAIVPDPVPEADPVPEPDPAIVPDPVAPKPKPKSKSNRFDELLAEGCKLAKGSSAEQGLRLLQKAHDMKPGGAKVTLCMAQAHRSLGRNASARAMCDRVLRKSPGSKQANLLMAKLEHERGSKAAAVRHYRKVLEVDPEHAAAKAYVEKNG